MKQMVFRRWCIGVTAVLLLSFFAVGVMAEDGKTADAVRVVNISELNIKNTSVAENIIGDLFADAIRSALETDVALIASSEIRTKVADDNLPVNDLSSLVNYPEDTITVLQITGKQLLNALEQSLSSYPKPTLRFLQVSGLSFTFDPAKPQGSRIVSINVGKEKLSEQKIYSVGVTRSLARGALGYWKIWSRNNIKSPDNPPTLVDAVNEFVKNKPLDTDAKLNRILVYKKEK